MNEIDVMWRKHGRLTRLWVSWGIVASLLLLSGLIMPDGIAGLALRWIPSCLAQAFMLCVDLFVFVAWPIYNIKKLFQHDRSGIGRQE